MRFEGVIQSWNDERGFGFIAPRLGGEPVFVHVKAFGPRDGRPSIGQAVSFEVETGARGRKRATAVRPIGRTAPVGGRKVRENPVRGSGDRDRPAHAADGFGRLVIPLFVVVYVATAVAWHVPPTTLALSAALYVAMSVVCGVAYTLDKSAALDGRRRVPERTLLLLGLCCGWPGAVVAQRLLRHKTVKASFQAAFKASVAANVVGFVALSSPWVGVVR